MKIIRFLTAQGDIRLGAVDADNPEEAVLLDGELFEDLKRGARTERIARLLCPIEPPNILAVGLNYGKHAEETRVSRPEIPVLFIKATTSAIGNGETILLPTAGPDAVDYEAELAVIIGRTAKNVAREEAMRHVFGYCCANDVSARDWQIEKQKRQWSRGKSFDTFCPLGPWITTADEIPEPNRLRITSILNGKIMQDSNTADMIFDIPTLVSDLSQSITLLPGTVILTGTPEGVGFTRKPPVFLQAGDEIIIEIEGLGRLRNRVEKEASNK